MCTSVVVEHKIEKKEKKNLGKFPPYEILIVCSARSCPEQVFHAREIALSGTNLFK